MSIDKQQIGLLLSKVALQDSHAFEALYQLTNIKLYGLIRTIVKDEQIAADLLQEGFIKLWYRGYQYSVDYPWAWLSQNMRNLAIDEIRKRNRRGEVPLENISEKKYKNVEAILEPKLGRCLLLLTEEKRNVIVLAYQHGLSHHDIAQHVKSPIGTIKSWIRRGLLELKKCLIE